MERLSEQERTQLAAYLFRHSMPLPLGEGEIPAGTTIADALKSEQTREVKAAQERAQKDASEKALKAAKEEMLLKLNNALTVQLLEKEFISGGSTSYQISEGVSLKFVFKNTSDKDLAGFKGDVRFKDMFGDLLHISSLTFEDGLKAREQITETYEIHPILVKTTTKRFIHLDMSKMTYEFEPQSIVFADGTKLTMPED